MLYSFSYLTGYSINTNLAYTHKTVSTRKNGHVMWSCDWMMCLTSQKLHSINLPWRLRKQQLPASLWYWHPIWQPVGHTSSPASYHQTPEDTQAWYTQRTVKKQLQQSITLETCCIYIRNRWDGEADLVCVQEVPVSHERHRNMDPLILRIIGTWGILKYKTVVVVLDKTIWWAYSKQGNTGYKSQIFKLLKHST